MGDLSQQEEGHVAIAPRGQAINGETERELYERLALRPAPPPPASGTRSESVASSEPQAVEVEIWKPVGLLGQFHMAITDIACMATSARGTNPIEHPAAFMSSLCDNYGCDYSHMRAECPYLSDVYCRGVYCKGCY